MRRRRKDGRGGSASSVPVPPTEHEPAASWSEWLSAPVAAAPLLLFRSGWATCLLKEIWDEQPRLPVQYGPGVLNFKYPIAPLPTPSLPAVQALYVVMATAATFLVVAPWLTTRVVPARIASAALGIAYGTVFLFEAQRYNNHYYLSIVLSAWFAVLDVHYATALPPAASGAAVPRWQLLAVQVT